MNRIAIDDKVFNFNEINLYNRFGYFPWQKLNETYFILSANNAMHLKIYLKKIYKHYQIVIVSQEVLEQSLRNIFAKKIQKEQSQVANQEYKYFFCTLLLMATIFLLRIDFTVLLLNIMYASLTLFKASVLLFNKFSNNNKPLAPVNIMKKEDWPYYSIILPLYKEANMVAQLVENIMMIDYPKDKLDVKIVLEEDDLDTINAMQNIMDLPKYFKVILVPDSSPKTKGKACNYAVNFIKGDYLTIYDAEDKPDILQLKKAIHKFRISNNKCVALQAQLHYCNYKHNSLTRLFALEYAFHFNRLIPFLSHINAFVPLGGSSNHLIVKEMHTINWWDSYNVTEDIELAMKIFAGGKTISSIESVTWEQSPIAILPWIKQRSRWIKGFMQTFLCYMKAPIKLNRLIGCKKFITFNIMVTIPIFANIFTPILLLMPLLKASTYSYYFCYINFFLAMAINLITSYHAIEKYSWQKHILAFTLTPFYWLLSSVATYKALYELITKPHYWDKTKHH